MSASVIISIGFPGASDPVPVQALRLDRDLAHPVGRAEVVLPFGVSAPDAGAEVTIAFTQGDTKTDVMTGHVAQRSDGLTSTSLTVLEPTARMMVPSPDKSYGTTTAGQVISDLCDSAGTPSETILPGATIPHLVLRSDQTMLDHAKRLAHVSGLVLCTTSSGALTTVSVSVPVPGTPPAIDRAQLQRETYQTDRPAADTRIVGAGAVGTGGPGMSTLPLADPGLMSAGPSDAAITDHRAIIRSLADATIAQLAVHARRQAANGGVTVTTPLLEDLSPGDVVLLPDANGLPIRLSRLEALHVSLTARTGLLARYSFSDVEVV